VNKYLLIAGNLYMMADCWGDQEHQNRYPCSLGRRPAARSALPAGTIRAKHGDGLYLFGRDFEVNYLGPKSVEDEIDLELVAVHKPAVAVGE
jgi:hypothetical protein